MSFDDDGWTGAAQPGPWPAFVDLFAATALIMLVLFAVLASRYAWLEGKNKGLEAEKRGLEVENQDLRSTQRMADSTMIETQVESLYHALDTIAKRSGGFSVRRQKTTVLIVLEEGVSFPRGRSAFNEMELGGRERLREIWSLVSDSGRFGGLINEVEVVGHADITGSAHTNWMLSAQRAAAVTDFLVESMNYNPCHIRASGRSYYYPRSMSATAAAPGTDPLAADRRVEISLRSVMSDTAEFHRCQNLK